ncbi:MAG: 30S ribosomal protein S12 methylthiotransferase RimO [Chitinophagaceae bacterium]|nr:MAG: 30S ribosomal protein S12 methylthiotransferase RimO [Chitinophagaceae bacterium]
MKTKPKGRNKVNVITLGCSKNLVDSEVLMAQLKAADVDVAHEDNENERRIVIINTCGFIDNAKEESVSTILQYADAKVKGLVDKVYVTGCLSQRYKSDLEKEIPEVDAYFGTRELPRLLKQFKADYKHELVGERLLTSPAHYAYLKISEGCNRTCAFCAIPLMRGKHISKPIEELVNEAKKLAAKGVVELMLIAQELTYYGLDIYKKRALNELLLALSEVEGIEWIKLHYAYPSKFPVEIFDAMNESPKVCNYLDMPLQHISNNVLNNMKRQITKEEIEALLRTAREKVPGIAIRTTMLVGFPGETEADFEELKDFVKEQKFDRLGVFAYSHEENTFAGDHLKDDVPHEVKQQRCADLMEIQQEISFKKNTDFIGKVVKVLIDKKESGYFVGRTAIDSPEVDNEVLITAENEYLSPGSFVDVEITNAGEFDLYAVPLTK